MARRTGAGWDRILAAAVWFGTLVTKREGRYSDDSERRPSLFCFSTRTRVVSAALVPLLLFSTVNIGGVAVPVSERAPLPMISAPPSTDPIREEPQAIPERLPESVDVEHLPHTGQLSREDVQRLMVKVGFPAEEIGTGIEIATAESSRRPDATNTDGNRVGKDLGLWQINTHYWGEDLSRIDWTDPLENTGLAFTIWQSMGWDGWTTYDPSMDDAPAPLPMELPEEAPVLVSCPATWHTDSEPNVAQVANLAAGALDFTGTIGGYAYRGGSSKSDHTRGLALDFMTYGDLDYGWKISNWFVDNAERLDVKYVIFAQEINSLDGRDWRPMEDRGGITANHYDHPHVSFHRAPADHMCEPEWVSAKPDWNRSVPAREPEPSRVPEPEPQQKPARPPDEPEPEPLVELDVPGLPELEVPSGPADKLAELASQ